MAKASAFSQLSDQHKAFVRAYLKCFNAAKAAIEAGYAESNAYDTGSRLQRNTDIAAAISEQLDNLGITEERIKSEFAQIALDSDLADFEGLLTNGRLTLKEARKLGLPTKRIKKLKITRRVVGTGEGAYPVEDVQIELHDPQRALEALAKVRAMFVDRQRHEGKVSLERKPEEVAAEIEKAYEDETRGPNDAKPEGTESTAVA